MILTDLDARSLQLTFSGQAVTAAIGWGRGVFVGPYHPCQLSCHVEVTSGGGHGLGQVIRFCCDICKCLHPPVVHLVVSFSMISMGTILNDQISLEIISPLPCLIGVDFVD